MNNITCKKLFDLRGGTWETTIEQHRRVYSIEYIAPTIMAGMTGNDDKSIKVAVSCAMRGRTSETEDRTEQHLEIGGEVANSLTTVQKDSLVMIYEDKTSDQKRMDRSKNRGGI